MLATTNRHMADPRWCSRCIEFARLIVRVETYYKTWDLVRMGPFSGEAIFRERLSDLRRTYRFCEFCRFIVDGLRIPQGDPEMGVSETEDVEVFPLRGPLMLPVQVRLEGGNVTSPGGCLLLSSMEVYVGADEFRLSSAYNGGRGGPALRAYVHCDTDTWPAQAGIISDFAPFQMHQVAAASQWIRRILRDCQENHAACAQEPQMQTRSSTQVRRMIDVGSYGGENVRLCHWTEWHQPYIALSHCWGSVDRRPLQTTRANYSEHLSGIDLASLPLTFRHAVQLTRELGVRYLWVDSLCIIQDDPDDWAHESKRMGALYAQSFLTFAAAHAQDASEGLLPTCKATGPSLTAKLPIFGGFASANSVFSVTSQSFPAVQQKLGETPLAQRAWALQEWLLSRRIVFFLEDDLLWRCEHGDTEGLHPDGRREEIWTYTGWIPTCLNYCSRQLTRLSDKLIALDGLADWIATLRSDRYSMGVWENSIHGMLLWKVISLHPRHPGLKHIPTWSWASVDGRCSFPFLMAVNDLDDQSWTSEPPLKYWDYSDEPCFPTSELLFCGPQLEHVKIHAGLLHLQSVAHGTWIDNPRKRHESDPTFERKGWERGRFDFHAGPDVEYRARRRWASVECSVDILSTCEVLEKSINAPGNPRAAHLFPAGAKRYYFAPLIETVELSIQLGLVLRETDEPEVFHRIGLGRSYGLEWVRSQPWQVFRVA